MSVDAALAGALDEKAPDRREHIRWLIECTEQGLDERIEAILRDRPDYKSVPPEQRQAVMWAGLVRQTVLSRVLVERQPDMDPRHFFEVHFGPGTDQARQAKRVYGRIAVSYLSAGFARLRRANPVSRYAAGTRRWFGLWRSTAVVALGDTADPAALPHLLRSLRDRDAPTRGNAVDAIRRLHRHGAVPSVDEVADHLAARLADPKPSVAESAAVALAELGVRDLPAGEVRPLLGLWPGEIGYVAPSRK